MRAASKTAASGQPAGPHKADASDHSSRAGNCRPGH